MRIRSKLIRTGGSVIDLGKGKDARRYHFKPLDPAKPGEDHVCDVTDGDDIATFLAIKEGYEVHPSEVKSRVAPSSPPPPPKPTTLTEIIAAGQDGEASKAKLAPTRAQLIEAVTGKTGKKPHPTTSNAKLQAILDAAE